MKITFFFLTLILSINSIFANSGTLSDITSSSGIQNSKDQEIVNTMNTIIENSMTPQVELADTKPAYNLVTNSGALVKLELNFGKIDTLDNLYGIVLDSTNKDIFINFWNSNTSLIGSFIEIDSCSKWKTMMESNIKDGKELFMTKKSIAQFVGCTLSLNKKFTYSEIAATNESYRRHNIGTGLGTLDNKVWKNDTTLSIYDNVMSVSDYVYGYALVMKNGKVGTQKELGGGLCGVSTVNYQAGLKTSGIVIEERLPHMNYYTSYYGPIVGLDATIYGNGSVSSKDLKMKNITGQNIFIKTSNWVSGNGFYYGVYYYHPYPTDRIVSSEVTREKKKGGKTCVKNYIKDVGRDDVLTSCYYGIY